VWCDTVFIIVTLIANAYFKRNAYFERSFKYRSFKYRSF
jgi:hypothetical protein